MLQPTTFTILADRDRQGPWGAFGGGDAAVAAYVLIRDGVETRLGSKSTTEVIPGDIVSVRSCGGGGYGPPAERDPARVLRDCLEGKVSAERAREEYLVAIEDRRVDEQATIELRRRTT
jgi:N-methylhydantoinase B